MVVGGSGSHTRVPKRFSTIKGPWYVRGTVGMATKVQKYDLARFNIHDFKKSNGRSGAPEWAFHMGVGSTGPHIRVLSRNLAMD